MSIITPKGAYRLQVYAPRCMH